jgi:hypothetical protein
MKKTPLLIVLLLPVLAFMLKENSSPSVVKVKSKDGKYSLTRNGEPYFIKGAGGYENFERVKQYGGNSVRLWSTNGVKKYLDWAHSLGLTVTLGLELASERHGFDYSNAAAVKKQFEELKTEILTYKDHPALLMWAVGNEVEYMGENFDLWDAVNDIVIYIHKVDPNHPTTTMLAGVPQHHIKEIIKRCPELDILSINAFKDVVNTKEKITNAGWKGPYLIGEWGASGYWERDTTQWGAFIEETSTEKTLVCEERYKKGILANTDRCLGSYIFYWGYKQARTHTLLSLFLESGEEIGVLDVLEREWTGKTPVNTAPVIKPIGIDDMPVHKGVYLSPGTEHNAYTDVIDPDNDKLIYKWEIYYESQEKKEGGDTEEKPYVLSDFKLEGNNVLHFTSPAKPGPYRLFVYVFDGNNHVATANAPFYVKTP